MCGIGAILDPAGSAPAGAPQRMVEALRHRGPDGEGVTRHGALTLVHARLAIIDVAGGDQPLHSEDGDVSVVVNGEIYNHPPCAPISSGAATASRRTRTARSSCTLYEEHGPRLRRAS